MVILGVVLLVGGFVGLLSSYSHVLNMLLSLELVMLSLLYFLGLWEMIGLNDLVFMLCFIVFMVGEGVLGLSVLITLVRGYGGDYYLSFNSLQC
uniref:NADH-ubiquinone oxidoreductase chain 4L n=1 Tax=Appalachioria falcifera TaxID=382869 RepID=S4SZI1_APPFA|nr:NADH dehydrogenase subunit 4L [Appalachioria falcifera]AFR77024.1 NADH dehydrogenase subunit 4L [Appalachioria falcifera]